MSQSIDESPRHESHQTESREGPVEGFRDRVSGRGLNDRSDWRRRLAILGGSVLLVFAVLGILAGIAYLKSVQIRSAMAEPPPPETPVAVRLVEAKSAQYVPSTSVVGTVLAPRRIMLRNEEAGTVTKVWMQPGGNVSKGDLLLEMDTRVERAELDAADATLRQAQSTLRRAERLARTNALSAEEFDVATASAARAKADIERLQAIIDRKTLKAPFDARVGLFQLHAGQYIDVGRELVSLEGVDDYVLVDFSVPAHVADAMEVGNKVALQVDRRSESLSANVSAMDSRADSESRLMRIRARMQNAPETLIPGDSVLVDIPFGNPIDVVVIPRTALRRSPSGDMVFVAKKDPKDGTLRASIARVRIASTDDSKVNIVGGIRAGQMIVADGSFKVTAGSLLGEVSP